MIWIRAIHRFFHRTHAAAALEFSFVFPVLALLMWGMVEAARYTIINQKLVKATFTIADLVTQNFICAGPEDLSDVYLTAARQVLRPYPADDSRFGVVFTSVASGTLTLPPACDSLPAGADCVVWQYTAGGVMSSAVGSTGHVPSMPGPDGSVSDGQNMLVVETSYRFTPMLGTTARIIPAFSGKTIYNVAVYKPRVGDIISGCK